MLRYRPSPAMVVAVIALVFAMGGVSYGLATGSVDSRFAPFTLGNGENRVLETIGPFTLTATCAINQAGVDTAAVQITTSQNDSALDADDSDGDFDVGDTHNFLTIAANPTGTPELDANEDGTALAPDGTEILGQGLYVGVNVLGEGGRCRYGGTIYVG